jgi:hypothetical protein
MTDHKHGMPAAPTTIANDTLWAAAGDLAVGTGSHTAAKLGITVPAANILEVLGVVNGETTASWKAVHDSTAPSTQAFGDAAAAGTALTASHRDHKHAMMANPWTAAQGSSLPAQPAYGNNVPFFYTAAGYFCWVYYDGTRWLSEEEYPLNLSITDTLQGGTTAPSLYGSADQGPAGAYCTRAVCMTYEGTNNGTNYVTYTLRSYSPAVAGHTLGSAFNTSGDTQANYVGHIITVNAVVTAGDTNYQLAGVKTLSPAVLYVTCMVYYRKIAT